MPHWELIFEEKYSIGLFRSRRGQS